MREHRLTNDPRFSSEVLVSPRQRLGTGRRRRTAGYGAVTGWRVVDLAGSSFPSAVPTSGCGHVQAPIVWRNERLEVVERLTARERRAFQQDAARA